MSGATGLTRRNTEKEHPVLKRLPFILFLLVAVDFLVMAGFWHWFGWKPTLAENGLMTIVGLIVIIYYEWRWSEAVAKRLEIEPVTLDRWSVEKILLLVAGVVLLIPGFLTDILGLVLLIPRVRRLIVTRSRGVLGPLENSLAGR
jgi:UPF0716 protein FxsA